MCEEGADIDVCLTNPCDAQATCTDNPPPTLGANCTCNPGYMGDGHVGGTGCSDYVYWSDDHDDDIKRAHRDGSGMETIIDTGSSVAEGLALDHAGLNIYWSVRDAHAIYVANKDGSSARTLLTSPAIELPEGIVLDPIYG
ncbi:LRP4 [Branchiostoma lanceolatum]|uniref:LRP4 protein n=1 Tax=Branchiostoma lanceolatum TaxID=7740 RepID=A0A8J9Z6Z6_BRALA|nr:LRP4 [Branchiostoma lanceolatum]